MYLPKSKIKLCIAAIILNAALVFSQSPADSVKTPPFTQDEFNIMVQYVQRGSIPMLSDSSTIDAIFSLRARLDSVVTKRIFLSKLILTKAEKNIVAYLYRNDLAAAVTLIRLNEKLAASRITPKALAKK